MEIAGRVEMDRGIARFADGVADYRPVWPVIEDDFYAHVKGQFKSEGEQGGERWKALSEPYGQWKEAHYPGKPILERTGDLVASLTTPNDRNAVRIEERKTLALGSRLPYAAYHQTGSKDGGHPPKRVEVILDEAFKRSVMHNVQIYLVTIASQSGFRGGWSPLSVNGARRGQAGQQGWRIPGGF
jgi:phage gpG-like protein